MTVRALEEIEATLKAHKNELKERFGVREIGIFGSYARGEAKETSDIDILVDFYEVPSFFRFIELEEYLEELLGVRVDLVLKSALKPKISEYVMREVIYV